VADAILEGRHEALNEVVTAVSAGSEFVELESAEESR